jgi:hypothetical protein
MNHSKMILIDQQTLDRLGKPSAGSNKSQNSKMVQLTNPVKDIIIKLRNEMKQILRLKDLDANEKLSRYHQALQQYLYFISKSSKINTQTNEIYQPECQEKLIPEKKEVKQEIIDDQQEMQPFNTQTDSVDVNVTSEVENSADEDVNNLLKGELLQSVPEKKRNVARELYTILSDSKLIEWDHTGAVKINGRDIADSSIAELISDVVSNRQTSNPTGWQTFAEILEELKIPMKYISNVRRKKFIRSKHGEAVSSPNTIVEKSKKRKIGDHSPMSSEGNKRIKRRSARLLTTNWKRFNFSS